MSNLCSEILQTNSATAFNKEGEHESYGKDISCNLGSMNIYNAMHSPSFEHSVSTAINALSAVSDTSDLSCAPSVDYGNKMSKAIGLGQMNLHGFLASEGIEYGSQDSLDFTNIYFYLVTYYALKASNELALVKNKKFKGFEKSSYADGSYFDKYITEWKCPANNRVLELFERCGHEIPIDSDWELLKANVIQHGLYNAYLQAVPPTGSISYLNHSTSSIHPIATKIERREEGKTGNVYYAAPHMTNDNRHLFKDAYELGWKATIDVYAEATKHVDQGLSCTIFVNPDVTTRELNKAQIYAWSKGLKTLYYVRVKQEELNTEECQACML